MNISTKQRSYPVRLFNKYAPFPHWHWKPIFSAAEDRTGMSSQESKEDKVLFLKLFFSGIMEGDFNRLGNYLFRKRMALILENRWRMKQLFKLHPEIKSQEIQRPIFLIGSQASGVTLLHRLLANDTQFRTVLPHEGLNPAPPLNKKDDRVTQAKWVKRIVKQLSPKFIDADPHAKGELQLDHLLTDFSFHSTGFQAMMEIPSYIKWISKQDATPAYNYLKKILQLLQWKRPARPWVLKNPQFMEQPEALHRVFPDAVFVIVHRNPTDLIPDEAKLLYHGKRIFSDELDIKEAHLACQERYNAATNRLAAFRTANKDFNAIDLSYEELTAEPKNCLEKIKQAMRRSLVLQN